MNPLNVLIGLVRFESMLALILAAVPIALRIADDRGSISAYHDMADPRWFFVPLTAASMMLITNGLVRSDSHGYNTALGVLLLGVVLFDHDGGSAIPHFLSAVPFFVLGAALRRTDDRSLRPRAAALAMAWCDLVIIAAMATACRSVWRGCCSIHRRSGWSRWGSGSSPLTTCSTRGGRSAGRPTTRNRRPYSSSCFLGPSDGSPGC